MGKTFFFLLIFLLLLPVTHVGPGLSRYPALKRMEDLVLMCGLVWIRAGPTEGKVELSIKP